MNYAAVEKIKDVLTSCISKFRDWAGDIRLGRCMLHANVSVVQHASFWSQNLFLSLGRDKRQLSVEFPSSLHNMRNGSWTMELFKLEQQTPANEILSWKTIENYFRSEDMLKKFPEELYKRNEPRYKVT